MQGLDINPAINTFSRALGFHVHDGDIMAFQSRTTVDAVAIWNTFDQLADPRAALRRAWMLLRPGGIVAIRVPNGAFYAKLRGRASQAGPGGAVARLLLAENNLLVFPYRFGFTPPSLGQLLLDVGFERPSSRADVLVPVADEWTRHWARTEERAVKTVLGWAGAARVTWAPWFETYAWRPHRSASDQGRQLISNSSVSVRSRQPAG